MDFEPSQEQRALRESTRRLLAEHAPLTRTRHLADAGDGWDRGVWARGADLGWPALAVPEQHGGLGQGLVDLALVALEHGRTVLPSPLLPTVVVADALARAGGPLRDRLLPGLLAGELTAAWALAERGRPWSGEGVRLAATPHDGGYRLSGTKVHVQDASSADVLLVEAVCAGEPARFLVRRDAPGVAVRRQRSLDLTRELSEVTFVDVDVAGDACLDLGAAAAHGTARALQRAAVLACAELVGVGERLLEMTVEYAAVRVQFDRPIGSFQAVKHKCATMRLWLQASTAATLHAAMVLDAADAADAVEPDGDDSAVDAAASATKAYVSEAIPQLAGEALQVHGGIGFTWEHDLHLYLRRAKANALLHGDAAHHRELLCRAAERAARAVAPVG